MKTTQSLFFRILKLFIYMSIATLVLTTLVYLPIGRNYIQELKVREMQPVLDSMENIMQDYANGMIDERSMDRIVIAQSVANNAQMLIADTDGKVIFATKAIIDDRHEDNPNNLVDISAATEDLMRSILAQGSEISQTLTLSGTNFESIFLGQPIEINGKVIGAIALVIPSFEITRSVNGLIVSLILSMVLVMALMSIVIYLFTKRLSKPINQMMLVANEMSGGNFSLKADETDHSEIGALGASLNRMSQSLKDTLQAVSIERNRLKMMLESMQEGVVSIDSNQTIMIVNPAFYTLFELDPEADPKQSILNLDIVQKTFESGLTGKLTSCLFDYQNRKIACSVSPIVNEEGQITGCIGIFTDRSESERLEQLRRDYVANVSHELRTPLTTIRALLDPLNDGLIKDEEKKRDYYRTLLKETDRLNRLINDLLELSRLQGSNESFGTSNVDLNALMEEIREKFDPIALQKDIRLILELPGNKISTKVNEDRMEQVLSILVDNALKFTPDGGKVTLSLLKSMDGKTRLSVRDDGQGISPRDLPHIFERFYTADKARTQKSFGLGLSIAKEILDRMQAQIKVESTINQGTCFTIILP